jgi:hypothetical protein
VTLIGTLARLRPLSFTASNGHLKALPVSNS